MMHLLRPPSASVLPAADVLLRIPRCILTLEEAVRDLLSDFWDEAIRQRAYGLARSMSEGCKVCGFRESSCLLRSIEGLLSLPYEDTRGPSFRWPAGCSNSWDS